MRARIFLGFLLLLAPLAAGPAGAQPAQPLDRLLPQIRRDHPGQFLDAEGFDSAGAPHYHLKWLTPDGRVIWFDADARSGRVVGQSPGRDRFDPPRYGGVPDRSEEGRSEERAAPRYRQQPSEAPQYGRRLDDRGGANSGYDRQNGNGRFGGGREGGPPGGGQRFGNGGGGNRGFGGGRDRGGR